MRAAALALVLLISAVSAAAALPALQAPATAKAGAEVDVTIDGAPPKAFVGIVPTGSRDGSYDAYRYPDARGSARLMAPPRAGEFEIRLMDGKPPYPVLARRPLTVEPTSASLDGPSEVKAGATFRMRWTGPGHKLDFVTIVAAGSPETRYGAVVYLAPDAVDVRAPDAPGDYEVRYLAAQSYATLARVKLKVLPMAASVRAPEEALAGEAIAVQWEGPDHPGDYITILPKTAHEGASANYTYTALGKPAQVRVPLEPGVYEVRYSTGQSHTTLARAALRVKPAREEPGLVSVAQASIATDAVEVILDASGSMLLRMGSQRRIDVARQVLLRMTSSVLPAQVPFALRIFGREVDSCQSDLDIPLGPLDPRQVAERLKALEVKNMARTPIGASLEKAAQDLASAKGDRLVVLVTDGEETCGGDPGKAIERLARAGGTTRVNIIGFAVDDAKLEASFRHWAQAGHGAYFSARDPAALTRALTQALRLGFEVVGPQGHVVAEGIAGEEAVRVPPGEYTVRRKGSAAGVSIRIKSRETASVRL